jgi:hypothetical protein
MRFEPRPLTEVEIGHLVDLQASNGLSILLRMMESEADLIESTTLASHMANPLAVIAGNGMTLQDQEQLKEAAQLRLAIQVIRQQFERESFVIHKPHAS